MAAGGEVKGLEEITRNINRQIAAMPRATMAGLMAAGLIVQRDAQLHVPVDTGNLKASAFTRKAQKSSDRKPAVEVGFTASYAVFVHENMEQKLRGVPRTSGSGKGRYWDPQGRAGPKFLQNAVADNQRKIVDTIAAHAKVKP